MFQHVRSSTQGEKKLTLQNGQTVFVDGYHEATNTVYEFMGCTFHACPKCHPYRWNQSRYCHPDRTCDEVYESTLKKVVNLRAAGYRVVVKWECEYLKEKATDPDLIAFIKSFHLVTPLEPRDAFFGDGPKPLLFTPKQPPERQ